MFVMCAMMQHVSPAHTRKQITSYGRLSGGNDSAFSVAEKLSVGSRGAIAMQSDASPRDTHKPKPKLAPCTTKNQNG